MGLTGFEPVTARLWAERSNLTELQALIVLWRYYIFKYAFNNNIFAYAFCLGKSSIKNTKFTPLAGLEPTTFWLTARHSTNWVKAAHVIGCALFAHPIANTPKAIIIFIYFAWNCFNNYIWMGESGDPDIRVSGV